MKNLTTLFLTASALILHGCGGSSGITTSSSFSSSGIISSPFSSATASASTIKPSKMLSSKYTDLKKKIDDLLAVTTGKAADCQALVTIDFSKFNSANANCYGPSITLTGTHPDGAMTAPETRPGGDLGIWDAADSSGQACAAAQVTSLTDYAGAMPFYSQLLSAYLYCYINNSGGSLALPTVAATPTTLGASDLASFGFTSSKDVVTATSATVTLISDAAGNPGYRYEIQGTMKDGDLTPAKTLTYKIINQYAKAASGAQAGTSSYSFLDSSPTTPGNCGAGNSINFAGKETFNLNAAGTTDTIMLKHAEFCGSTSNPLNATTYDIDFSDKKPGSSTGWGNNANYVLFSFNPSTLDGSYVYAWQAGAGDSHTRLFNATISTAGTTQSGTGYVGFGTDMTATATLGQIKGMICNWTGTGSAHTVQNYVQSQAMTKNATTGLWTATSSHIRFAPIVACFTSSACSLTYNSSSSTQSNDSAIVTTTGGAALCAGDLSPIADVASFTAPTAPTF